MMSAMKARQCGLLAILDDLGAATYSETEIDRFLESRELVLNKLNEKADAVESTRRGYVYSLSTIPL